MPSRNSVHHVNVLFLISFALSLLYAFWGVSSLFVRLLFTQIFIILLPSLLYLRWAGLPFKETVRWRWPGRRAAWGSLLIGAGLYPLGAVSAAVYQRLLGYRLFNETVVPQTVSQAALGMFVFTVLAPFCEEVLARGIIQRTYEELGARRAIFYAGFLFFIFHPHLPQGLAIIPVVLALGYVYWRSQSLPASMLTHFGANALASLVLTSSIFWQDAPSVLISLPSLIVGLLGVGLGLWLLRGSPGIPAAKSVPAAKTRLPRWPVVVIVVLYLATVGFGWAFSRFPEFFLPEAVLDGNSWVPGEWSYEIYNIANEAVGEIHCSLRLEENEVFLRKYSRHRAYEVKRGAGRYFGGEGERTVQVSWRLNEGRLLQGRRASNFSGNESKIRWELAHGEFLITFGDKDGKEENSAVAFPQKSDSLVVEGYAWPWMLSSLPFASDYQAGLYCFEAYTWRPATQDNGPLLEWASVTVSDPETVETPAGSFLAWKVRMGDAKQAWYTVEAPHLLVKYYSGMETWLLTDFIGETR